ncbi:Hint domain-containing protein [Pseudoroseicyclus tamaricis]|uniref:Hedgehog/Intein (Hint) domain-containing protein n=2 Tax=Pseudoroseicyclus tamaricis TaxID=2705421 RepID=A0A6B2JS51_9RHOB|nr:Hint domain-containing protein [Pseudoroseicyclus tamaricis]NDV00815.1 hypothetical protein [Pseudoroseicyclus tamaricis]
MHVAQGDDAAGLPAGALVLTLDGEAPIETLAPGSRIITFDSGMARLKEVSMTELTHAPVCIRAGSLGHFRPEADVLLGAGTLVHLRDWRAEAIFGNPGAAIPAARLVEGTFITREAEQAMQLYQLRFDRPHIIYAAGLQITT